MVATNEPIRRKAGGTSVLAVESVPDEASFRESWPEWSTVELTPLTISLRTLWKKALKKVHFFQGGGIRGKEEEREIQGMLTEIGEWTVQIRCICPVRMPAGGQWPRGPLRSLPAGASLLATLTS